MMPVERLGFMLMVSLSLCLTFFYVYTLYWCISFCMSRTICLEDYNTVCLNSHILTLMHNSDLLLKQMTCLKDSYILLQLKFLCI